MPRRRALRLLGISLVSLSIPGVRPRSGSARVKRASRCGSDERVCREFTANEYCCGPPSWQFFCGGSRGGCINKCTGEAKFPCTALVAHPESGINGVCCDRRLHSRCEPVGKAAMCCYGTPITCVSMSEAACAGKGGQWAPSERWKPLCVPCPGTACGPNRKYGSGHPLRWACCEKPNTCRKDGSCRCPDGKESCGGKECCKRGKTCKQCADADSSGVRLTGTVKCCGSDESCCVDRCCKSNTECCNGRCCPPRTQCAWTAGYKSRDTCCPQARVLSIGDRNSCCPVNTLPGEAGCCSPGAAECCAGVECESGSYCVRGKCVR